ncbi:CaiB/BaiF CoA transferase family protein [Roseovarius confluentis]|uniref:CaiB/BaiF CoA transferase family protein n=1 Tax=Roseovarius confluentis TaxID=1852027 RepID=UPI000CDE2012|nr:CoA transferase [Roseovarius confluentis]
MTTASTPLHGIRVLDFSRVLAGPFCTALLADVGADVIKVEAPQGDDTRAFEPRFRGDSGYFQLINRNKRSIVLDLKTEEGLQTAHKLARRADIVVENFKPGVTRRLGIDYETLCALNPRLVYASISGFGQTGPLSERPAYDIIAQAMSGLMSVNGELGGSPTRVGESMGDLVAGLQATWSILAALIASQREGKGQHLDVAMVDSLFSMMLTVLSQCLYGGVVARPTGNAHPLSAPLDSFEARDGQLIIAIASDSLFMRFANAIGHPELIEDPRFKTDSHRKSNEAELKNIIESWSTDLSVEAAVSLLSEHSIPASPVLGIDGVLASAHAAARELVTRVNHPMLGEIPIIRQPVKFLGVAQLPARPAPILGQHTEEILGELEQY